jgi:hypothetical protein
MYISLKADNPHQKLFKKISILKATKGLMVQLKEYESLMIIIPFLNLNKNAKFNRNIMKLNRNVSIKNVQNEKMQ